MGKKSGNQYPAIRAMLAARRMTYDELCGELEIAKTTLLDKLCGRSEFKLSEAKMIYDRFFAGEDMREVFRRDCDA